MTWELKHSVIADVDCQAVWAWYSNVDNWIRLEGAGVESITLDGPFQAGTHITTKMPGQEPTYSTLVEVEPPKRVVTEIKLNDAVLRFTWTFDALSDKQTRLTQHMLLEGPKSGSYVPLMEQYFVPNIGPGMEKMAEDMAKWGR
jgi:Polyketide cyclase / dehydrase and lipid transport